MSTKVIKEPASILAIEATEETKADPLSVWVVIKKQRGTVKVEGAYSDVSALTALGLTEENAYTDCDAHENGRWAVLAPVQGQELF